MKLSQVACQMKCISYYDKGIGKLLIERFKTQFQHIGQIFTIYLIRRAYLSETAYLAVYLTSYLNDYLSGYLAETAQVIIKSAAITLSILPIDQQR